MSTAATGKRRQKTLCWNAIMSLPEKELEHAVRRDTLRFHRQGLASWMIISVVPLG